MTLLFTDLSGSTALGRLLEVEDYSAILGRVRALWHTAAARHGGLVVRTQGDGAVLVFGYPEPGELDGLNAANAALAIHSAVSALNLADLTSGLAPAYRLQAHSGIHAGLMLIEAGDLERGRYDLVGDVANTAAKLQATAAPGEILASLAALGPHAGLLQHELVPLPTSVSPGLATGLVRVLGRSTVLRRFDATTERGLTPLVGRGDVLHELGRFLTSAAADGPSCAVLTAPAGMGKTRLLEELLPASNTSAVLRGTCERTTDAEVLQPFAQMLRALPEHLRPTLAEASVASYRAAFTRMAAQTASSSAPLILVLDDWQWADDASRSLLRALLSEPLALRVLVAARPQDDGTPWLADALQFSLRPLSPAETAQAVKRWLPDADPFLAERIHAHAGGVPLFIEELCHATTADLLARALDGSASGAPSGWLHVLVATRLQRLPEPAAHVVRAAAVIGVDAPLALLSAVCGQVPGSAVLQALSEADLLYAQTNTSLHFKHGMTHEAVYGAIGLAERRSLHRRVLEALPTDAASPETLAHHSWGAALWADTITHAEAAGDRAAAAFALDRARAHYRRAIDSSERLPNASAEQRAHACALAHKLAMACIYDPLSIGDGLQVFQRAVAHARELAEPSLEARCLYWLGYIEYALGRYVAGRGHAREALALAQRVGDAALATQVEAALGQILHATCDYDEALALIDAAVAAKRGRARPGSGVAVGSAYALACKGSMLADRGEFAAAWPCFEEAVQLLGSSSHPVGNSVRNWYAVACIWAERWDEAERIATASVAIAENTRALLLLAIARSTLGYARWRRGDAAGAFDLLHDAVAWLAARNGRMFTSLHFSWLAEACAAQGRTHEARNLAAHVLQRARHGERLGEAIAARAMASLELAAGRNWRGQRWLLRADRAAQARGSVREQALNARLWPLLR